MEYSGVNFSASANIVVKEASNVFLSTPISTTLANGIYAAAVVPAANSFAPRDTLFTLGTTATVVDLWNTSTLAQPLTGPVSPQVQLVSLPGGAALCIGSNGVVTTVCTNVLFPFIPPENVEVDTDPFAALNTAAVLTFNSGSAARVSWLPDTGNAITFPTPGGSPANLSTFVTGSQILVPVMQDGRIVTHAFDRDLAAVGIFPSAAVTGVVAGSARVVKLTNIARNALALLTDGPDGAAISIFPGDGKGTFSSSAVTLPVPPLALPADATQRDSQIALNSSRLISADLNQDGFSDICVAAGTTVRCFLNDGKGGFGAPQDFLMGTPVDTLRMGDFNGDGKPDIAAFARNRTQIYTLWNASNPAAGSALPMVSAASYQPKAPIAPAQGVSAFAAFRVPVESSALPLATNLGGLSGTITGPRGNIEPLQLYFVSPTQVNFLMPTNAGIGLNTINIAAPDGTVFTSTIEVAPISPGLYAADASGTGLAAAIALRIKPGNVLSAQTLAAYDASAGKLVAVPIDLSVPDDQVYLELYGTGVRFRDSLANVQVIIGSQTLTPTYVGPQSQYPGLDQINVLLPPSLAGAGRVDIKVVVQGKSTNVITGLLQ